LLYEYLELRILGRTGECEIRRCLAFHGQHRDLPRDEWNAMTLSLALRHEIK
jgi:hypothetical protein